MSDERTNEELAFQATSTRLEGWERVQAVKELTRRANEATVLRRALGNAAGCAGCGSGSPCELTGAARSNCEDERFTHYLDMARKELGL